MDAFLETPVAHDDFNRENDIAIFMGPVMAMYGAIGREELKEALDASGVVLIDARPAEEYSYLHIRGALNVPIGRIEELAATLDPDSPIVVYGQDAGSAESAVAADKLNTLSFANVLRYQGGLDDWMEAGYGVEGEYIEEFKGELKEAA